MANRIPPQTILAAFNPFFSTLKVVLVDLGAYTYSDTHQFLSDIPVGARLATSANLSNVSWSIVSGVPELDADDVVISGVTSTSIEAYAIYQDTGNAATSRLIRFVDTPSSGLPLTPNNTTVTITFSPVSKIIRFPQAEAGS